MEKLYNLLKIAPWSFFGVFIGTSLCKWHDYRVHPDWYAMQSSPWYSSIILNAIFMVLAIAVMLAAMWVIRKKYR